jgi:hypothetical protein
LASASNACSTAANRLVQEDPLGAHGDIEPAGAAQPIGVDFDRATVHDAGAARGDRLARGGGPHAPRRSLDAVKARAPLALDGQRRRGQVDAHQVTGGGHAVGSRIGNADDLGDQTLPAERTARGEHGEPPDRQAHRRALTSVEILDACQAHGSILPRKPRAVRTRTRWAAFAVERSFADNARRRLARAPSTRRWRAAC